MSADRPIISLGAAESTVLRRKIKKENKMSPNWPKFGGVLMPMGRITQRDKWLKMTYK